MIAFEQCYYNYLPLITSYVVLMTNLIHSSKDLELLYGKGIVAYSMTSPQFGWFSYVDLFEKVQDYYENQLDKCLPRPKRYEWIKILKRDYFSTPWKVLSLIAAFILLVLTLLQTIYTLLGKLQSLASRLTK
ncbi:hypothetical protein RchiOBHm_Chr5g0070431 [Rosa chinensis]|uniref:Uncharacterized protein n=1 Tax=Rosa chinensis TaxID=74649 RepID=A0A2P6QK74_ROSCH|nr:hypothetical protein RchiOBHm_Chr5g0070431 [Rosa chinensis]